MVNARRRHPGPFYRLPHLVHQATPDFGIPLVLDHAAAAVQSEANRRFDDFGVHSDALGLREACDFFFRFAAFSESCLTRSFTMRSIRSNGIGSSSGN